MRSIRWRAIGPPAATATAVDELILFLPRIGIVVLELAGLSRVGREMFGSRQSTLDRNWSQSLESGTVCLAQPTPWVKLKRRDHAVSCIFPASDAHLLRPLHRVLGALAAERSLGNPAHQRGRKLYLHRTSSHGGIVCGMASCAGDACWFAGRNSGRQSSA